jgi:hypothetical protein
MGFDICDIIVATVTRVGAVNGLGKFPLADLRVTAQAFRIINALIAILPALDNELLCFFSRFRGSGYPCGLDTPFIRRRRCRPQHPQVPKE